jgi:hypothetical protein
MVRFETEVKNMKGSGSSVFTFEDWTDGKSMHLLVTDREGKKCAAYLVPVGFLKRMAKAI